MVKSPDIQRFLDNEEELEALLGMKNEAEFIPMLRAKVGLQSKEVAERSKERRLVLIMDRVRQLKKYQEELASQLLKTELERNRSE